MAGEVMAINKFRTTTPKIVTDTGDNILFPFSPPIFQSDLDQNFIDDLIIEGDKLNVEKHDWRHQLAGQMKHGGSYIYNDDFILKSEKYLLQYVKRFFDGIYKQFGDKQIGSLLDVQVDRRQRTNGKLRLDTMWINYQNKFDFNPPHTHRGMLSFVIFCKVPKNIFEDQAVSNTKDAGKILFSHGNNSHPLDNSLYPIEPYETLFLLFPANMTHFVPSFWTDNVRISVAGNFVVAPK